MIYRRIFKMELLGKNIQLSKFIILAIIVQMKSRIGFEAKVFNSIAALRPLIDTQAKIIKSIEAYLTVERKKINFIEEHISFSQQKLKEAVNDSKYFWHPYRAYSYLNRVGRGFGFILNLTKDRTGYFKDTSRLLYPTLEDLTGAAKSIVRLQTTYRMNITHLANGTLVSNFSRSNKLFVENVTPMTSEDCFALGLVNYTLQGFKGQLLWMKVALKKYYAEKCDTCLETMAEEILVRKIGEAYYNLGKYKQALKWYKRYNSLKPAHLRAEVEDLQQKLQENVDKGLSRKEHKTREEPKQAWKQPRKKYLFGCYEDLKPQSAILQFHQCVLAATSSYLMFQPVKIEMLSMNPSVAIFHDVISDREIEALLKLAQPHLMTDASVYDIIDGKIQADWKNEYHVAKCITLDKTKLADKLNQRMADIIGYDRKSNVSLRVTNYGIAGFYALHVDYLGYALHSKFSDGEGDRFIAFVYFLSEVEQGGALVFPDLGLKVYPEKGAVIAWQTLLPSGDGDLSVSHTTCPVIRGSRWIAVHWAKQVDMNYCPIWVDHGEIMTRQKYAQWKIKYKEAEAKFHKSLIKTLVY